MRRALLVLFGAALSIGGCSNATKASRLPDAGFDDAGPLDAGPYSLELNPGSAQTYFGFSYLESYLGEDGGLYEPQPFAFTDPARNISTYLVSAGLSPATPAPTPIDYLTLIRTQAAVAHQWNPSLSVGAVNAYLRAGHSTSDRPLVYRAGCR